MMRKLPGLVGAVAILWAVAGIGGGCTPTDRDFASGGQGGDPGCPTGFAECDGNPDTVCETDTTSSMAHCGTCDKACASALDATVACVAGTCSITACSEGRQNCDNFYDNGCETNPTTSFEHCGTCGNSCEAPDAITACVASACALAQCVNGKLDCDMDPKTGCEVDPASNVDHCGGCGNTCTLPHATMACVGAQCSFVACDPNFGDCNSNGSDGCEADLLSNPYHCGACGTYCGGGACKGGACNPPILVATHNQPPGKIDVFNGNIYISGRINNSEVMSVPVTGGSPVFVGAVSGMVHAMTVNSQGIFIASAQGPMRMQFDGTKLSYGTQTSRGIAIAANDVYWTALNNVRFSPIGTSNGLTLFTAPFTAFGLFIFKSDAMYWTLSDGSVWSASLAGMGKQEQIVAGSGSSPANIIADDANIYWSSSKGLHTATIAGADFKDLSMESSVRSIAMDGQHVYWTEEIPRRVMRIAKDGTAPAETLAIEQGGPYGLALDAQFVYWSNTNTGEIMKLAK